MKNTIFSIIVLIMCLSPITAYTNSKYVDVRNIGTRFKNTFNCGKCAECLKMKHLDYYLRTSAEFNHTYKCNGFSYWDTLTYNDYEVPVLHHDEHGNSFLLRGMENYRKGDLLTFNADDYRNFFKRLRINLNRDNYDINGNLKYFFVSEYGDKRGRPHYHVIFFVTIPDMTPHLFNRYVKNAWYHGINDISKTPKQKVLNGLGACNYVAKYVNKPESWYLSFQKYRDKYHLTDDDLKLVQPFHRQSSGYGISLVDASDPKHLHLAIIEGRCYHTDSEGLKTYPLPSYNMRKLFYHTVKASDDSLHWILNNDRSAIAYRKLSITRAINSKTQRYYDVLSNINNVFNTYLQNGEFTHKTLDPQKEIFELLDGRTLRDLAVYSTLYQGRIYNINVPPIMSIVRHDCSVDFIDYNRTLSDPDVCFDWWLNRIYANLEHSKCLRPVSELLEREPDPLNPPPKTVIKYRDFERQHVISQELELIDFSHELVNGSYKPFEHFDTILAYINTYAKLTSDGQNTKHSDKQTAQEKYQYIKQLYARI